MGFVLNSLTGAFTLAFVLTSMFGLGLGLTVREIVEPLTAPGLTIRALVANFVIVPAVAWGLARLFALDQDLGTGLVLMGTVAGAPLALKATQIAHGDVRFAVGLVTLQVVASVIYLPLVLPWLIPGIAVDAVALAIPLVLQVLLPLALGLVMHVRYDEEAAMARPIMSEIASISLAALLVLNLVNLRQVLALLGTGAIAAATGVTVLALAAGYLLGGPGRASRRALALGTGQRNFAAAFVIAEGSFADRPTVMLMLLAASLLSLALVMLAAGELGRRVKARGALEGDVSVAGASRVSAGRAGA
ncbi:MAG TPA: bile acid:sodium symporter [Gemmatimonadales bacterium]|nr:bile acid:sodium symporter [Gemmatimonadales bacterium]